MQQKGENDQYILTKGDNNEVHDRSLYAQGQLWLHKEDLMGKVRGYCPYIGIVTILLNDYPALKWAMLSTMAIMVLVAKDP